MDHLGKLLFGRPLRLRVLLWVFNRGDAVFYQSEAAQGANYSATAVANELDRLEALGMLRKFGRPSGNERQNYVRVDHPYWSIVAAAQSSLESGGTGVTEAS